jgi:hypothetical protein
MAAANEQNPSVSSPSTATEAGSIQAHPPAPPDAGSVQTQPPSPAETGRIPLPPAKAQPPMTDMEVARTAGRLDLALVAVVLALVFLLGSFAVKNSDFWMFMAAGRDLLNGKYTFGVDPYSYNTGDRYWANHAWLFDVLLYKTYQTFGDTALVVLKALGLVLLAGLLLGIRRRGQSLWLPAACTGLALLAASPRFLMQPTLASYLFLAVTLWLLQRPRAEAGEPASWLAAPRSYWLLIPLFVLWVNMDSWFLVGPLAVGLYLLGEVLQNALAPVHVGPDASAPQERRTLAQVLVVGLLALLVNPHHYHALTLPVELSFLAPVPLLQNDPRFQWVFYSPFQSEYFTTNVGLNVAGVAFFPLIAVTIASFWVNWTGFRWWRLLLVSFFLVWACYRWQAIPFFAIVAGPISVLNFQDFAARRKRAPLPAATVAQINPWPSLITLVACLVVLAVAVKLLARLQLVSEGLGIPDPGIVFLVFAGGVLLLLFFALTPVLPYMQETVTTWSLGGRLLTVLAGLLLLVAAWPGWLQAGFEDPWQARRVAWAVEGDPGLRDTATLLARLRSEGVLGADPRGFHVQTQLVNYCAWYCPEEKGFFDQRFALFPDVAESFLDLRGTVGLDEFSAKKMAAAEAGESPEATPGRKQEDALKNQDVRMGRLAAMLHDKGITHVVVSGNDPHTALRSARYLTDDRKQWTLLALNGRSVVLAWKDPAKGDAPNPAAPHRFDPDVRAFSPAEGETLPDQAPRPPQAVPDWARYYMNGPAPHPLAADEAQAHLIYFDSCGHEWAQKNSRAWQAGYAAGLVGTTSPASGLLGTSTLLGFRACISTPFFPPTKASATFKHSQMVDIVAQGMVASFMNNQEDGPPGAALLAVRAARRGVAANPDDALAYMRLYAAYGTLRFRTQERVWVSRFPALKVLRDVQMVAALSNALEIQPDLPQAHLELSQIFLQADPVTRPVPFRDLALEHRTEYLNLVRAAGRTPAESPDDFLARLDKFDQENKDLESKVQSDEQLYLVRSSNQGRLQKAMLALQMGLAKKALEVLLESDYVEFGIEGAQLELDLLLKTGGLRQLRKSLKDPLGGHLEFIAVGSETLPASEWFTLLFAAAEGNYREADQQLQEAIKQFDPTPHLAQVLAEDFLEMTPGKPIAAAADHHLRKEMMRQQQLAEMARILRERMNLQALRGVLALEAGDSAAARKHFETALQASIPPDRYLPMLATLGSTSPLEVAVTVPVTGQMAFGPILDFFARPMALRYEELFEAAKP